MGGWVRGMPMPADRERKGSESSLLDGLSWLAHATGMVSSPFSRFWPQWSGIKRMVGRSGKKLTCEGDRKDFGDWKYFETRANEGGYFSFESL